MRTLEAEDTCALLFDKHSFKIMTTNINSSFNSDSQHAIDGILKEAVFDNIKCTPTKTLISLRPADELSAGSFATIHNGPINDVEERRCFICLETAVDATNNSPTMKKWLKPCRCIGDLEWVHTACFQRWIDIRHPKNCDTCQSTYLIFPAKLSKFGMMLNAIDKYFRYPVYVNRFLLSISYLFGHIANWEYPIIRAMQRYHVVVERHPILKFILPNPYNNADRDTIEGLSLYGIHEKTIDESRLVQEMILTFSTAIFVGHVSVIESLTFRKRFVLGALGFIVFKGIVKILLHHQKFRRRAKRRVLDYNLKNCLEFVSEMELRAIRAPHYDYEQLHIEVDRRRRRLLSR